MRAFDAVKDPAMAATQAPESKMSLDLHFKHSNATGGDTFAV